MVHYIGDTAPLRPESGEATFFFAGQTGKWHFGFMFSFGRCCFLIGFLLAAIPSLSADDVPQFGFTGPEIFPIENQVSQLRAADFDGDGLMDLALANNARSKINILYNQTGKTNRAAKPASLRRDLNELPPDSRFRVESIASEKRISALAAVDLNGDHRPDLAYYGEPRELIVLLNEGTNKWSAPKRWLIDDAQLTPNALATGDLNGDRRQDLVLLAETHVYALFQDRDGSLREPQKIPFSGVAKSVQLVDVNGDGRQDLLLVNWEDRYPFRFRLQKPDGELGPEIYFAFSPIRSYWADNLEQKSKTQILTIAQNSGRAQVSEFKLAPAAKLEGGLLEGQFEVVPLQRTEKARRGVLWIDLNKDGLQDLLVSEPESGQVSYYPQGKDGGLSKPKTFPALAGVADLAAGDWDGDGSPDIFMLSTDERQVGVTRLDREQRLAFPTLVPLAGRPLVFAVGTLEPASKPVLAVIVDDDGKRSLQVRSADGKQFTRKLDASFRSNPSAMVFHDADQDGRNDLVILTPYEKVKVLRNTGAESFQELDIAAPGGAIEQPWLSTADVDADGKPELLLTQRNFLRAVILKQESGTASGATNSLGWNFHVKQQINGAASNSRLTGAATLHGGQKGEGGLFLLDAEKKALSFCKQDTNGAWQIVRNIPLPVSDFDLLQPVALGGTTINCIAMAGANLCGMLLLNGNVWELTELDSYESPIRDGHLTDVVTGDLDNDGRKDLVFLETARNYLDLVIFNKERKLVPGNRWQVFEERTFRSRRADLPEPREALIEDLTGDGKNDLAVLVHDRVLLYPQE